MTCTCPHCGLENKLAGWYMPVATPGQNQPEPAGLVYCGHCGRQFAPAIEQEASNERGETGQPAA